MLLKQGPEFRLASPPPVSVDNVQGSMDNDPNGSSRRLTLGEAILVAIEGRMSQADVARLFDVDRSTITRWVKNQFLPTLDDLAAIERAAQRNPGFIVTVAGYVELPTTVPQAIEMDPALTDSARRAMHDAYDGAVEASEIERSRRRN